ncbi:transposase family protein [Streptomyces sp. NPDC127069]|uniref:transposase family protein n=1 Tax=Streptomyces sp. NPDC127069 TaxID=3347128 RepID=UPI00366384AD
MPSRLLRSRLPHLDPGVEKEVEIRGWPGSNAPGLWIGLGRGASRIAEGVPSRVIGFWSSSGPALQGGSGRHARAERGQRGRHHPERLPDGRHRPRLKELLFPAVADIAVLSVDVDIEKVRLDAQCTTASAACPGCGACSDRVHSSYPRYLADVLGAGRSVVLQLRVRRFRCRNTRCPRRLFVEQISGLTRKYGQRTERPRSTLTAVGLALAGQTGTAWLPCSACPSSRTTISRLLEALPELEVSTPRVVGVDEYATCKGRQYGTVLVDVETRRPIDLLPDRETSSLAACSPSGLVSRWSAGTGRRSSQKAPQPGHRRGPGRGPAASVAQPERGRRTRRRPAPPLSAFQPGFCDRQLG